MKKKKEDVGIALFLAGVALFVLVLLSTVFLPSYFEMRTFNKFSDQKATYIDAMFSELRVMPASDKGE